MRVLPVRSRQIEQGGARMTTVERANAKAASASPNGASASNAATTNAATTNAANTGAVECIRVMLIDEHPLFRQGCRYTLEHSGECTIVAEASESRAGLELAQQQAPDVGLID